MPIPPSIKSTISGLLQAFCEKRVPAKLQSKVRLSFSWRGSTVTLTESRPDFLGSGSWVDHPIAQLRFHEDSRLWSLFCRDSSERWLPYYGRQSHGDFSQLLKEIDSDPTNIFWG